MARGGAHASVECVTTATASANGWFFEWVATLLMAAYLRDSVSTTAETLKIGPSPSRTSIRTRPSWWLYVKSLCLADSFERDIPRDVNTGQFLASVVTKDAPGVVYQNRISPSAAPQFVSSADFSANAGSRQHSPRAVCAQSYTRNQIRKILVMPVLLDGPQHHVELRARRHHDAKSPARVPSDSKIWPRWWSARIKGQVRGQLCSLWNTETYCPQDGPRFPRQRRTLPVLDALKRVGCSKACSLVRISDRRKLDSSD